MIQGIYDNAFDEAMMGNVLVLPLPHFLAYFNDGLQEEMWNTESLGNW